MLVEPKEFDQPLPQSVLDLAQKQRSNLLTWNGQFSPQLVESLLLAYRPAGATVLDPFSGSGTVLYEAGCLGAEARGFDVNPAAWILSRTYHLMNVVPRERADLLSAVKAKIIEHIPEPGIFEDAEAQKISLRELSQALASIYGMADTRETLVLDSLVILLDLAKHEPTKQRVHSTLFRLAKLVEDLPYSEAPIKAALADARSLPVVDGKADFVLTSPPYINVFNYHQNYRRSAETLGWDLLKVAKSEIGSNRANRGNRFLTVTQYCLDMAHVLRELCRVSNESSRLILVVGYESNVLGVPFYNAAIISRLASVSGAFESCLTQKRVFRNRFGRHIREELLHLSSNGALLSEKAADEVARIVAVDVLKQGLERAPEESREALEEAVSKVPYTAGTPLWSAT